MRALTNTAHVQELQGSERKRLVVHARIAPQRREQAIGTNGSPWAEAFARRVWKPDAVLLREENYSAPQSFALCATAMLTPPTNAATNYRNCQPQG